MWGFLNAIFNKIASVAVTVLVAVGLVSAPALPPAEEPLTIDNEPQVALEESKEPEKKAVPTANVIDVFTPPPSKPAPPPPAPLPPPPAPAPAPQYFTTPAGITLDKFGNVVSSSGSVSVQPAPSPAPAPPGTFRLPNGALVDVNGNIIQAAPSATLAPTPPSPPAASDSYSPGSTIAIARSALAVIEFNPNLDCELLGLSLSDIKKCKLYRTSKSDYTWNIVD